MKTFIHNNPVLVSVVILAISVGAAMLTSWAITLGQIGTTHQNSGAFEQKCAMVNGALFESRSSGICYDTSGKILFTTGTGGFGNFH